MLDDVLEAVLGAVPPVIVLGRDDLRAARVSDLLVPAVLASRDHEIPSQPPDLRLPIVIFGGIDAPRLRLCLSGLATKLSGRRFLRAVLVRKALGKSVQQLYGEILQDHERNQAQ